MQPVRIVFYGNFGAGNLGNEVTLQAAIEQSLARLPDARLLCVCSGPQDVRARHGIDAVPSRSRDSASDLSDRAAGAGARLRRIVFRRLPRELAHWYRMLRVLARSDVLVVPGTGIVTDSSGSFGWPYELFKLTALARLCRTRVIFLSVGAGPFRHRLACWLIRRSLSLAHYRSYRDTDSKRRLQDIGFDAAHDAVYPDLVFGLTSTHLLGKPTDSTRSPVVALGLKDYALPAGEADAQSYRDYLDLMAAFVIWLQARGRTVRLIIGDVQFDTRVREDLIAVLRARGAAADEPQLLCDPVPTVDELLRQLREADTVVSPRFHNLVLALMLDKPIIALADLPKVTALLADLGLSHFCLPLEGLGIEDLSGRFVQLENDAASLKSSVRELVEKYRHSVDEQCGNVYATVASARQSSR